MQGRLEATLIFEFTYQRAPEAGWIRSGPSSHLCRLA